MEWSEKKMEMSSWRLLWLHVCTRAPLHTTMVTLQLMISLQSMVTIIDFWTLICYGAVLLWYCSSTDCRDTINCKVTIISFVQHGPGVFQNAHVVFFSLSKINKSHSRSTYITFNIAALICPIKRPINVQKVWYVGSFGLPNSELPLFLIDYLLGLSW